MDNDRSQSINVVTEYPEVAERLIEGYERWWQSIMEEGVNERYGYIRVGTLYENPCRISVHDLMTGKPGLSWHQYGAVKGAQATGILKIEFAEDGEYRISLRRFPRESGLCINETFPAKEKDLQLETAMPASIKSDFQEAYLYVADLEQTLKIEPGQAEVTFQGWIPAGRYNLEAQLIDSDNKVHPAYYIYIEKF
jgi:hypothetical protein